MSRIRVWRVKALVVVAVFGALADAVDVWGNGAPVSAVILDAPDMPVKGAASEPEVLARILGEAGVRARMISATELADPAVLDPESVDILVLPTGESFPVVARESVVAFLHAGGGLIATGGYAFNHLLRQNESRWVSEADALAARYVEITRPENSLLRNGDFDAAVDLPEPGRSVSGGWSRDSASATVVEDVPGGNGRCAAVILRPDESVPSATFWQDIPAKVGHTYRVAGRLRTRDVLDTGIAYIAAYQYGEDDKVVAYRDFAVARGTTDWAWHEYSFTAQPGAKRISVRFGLYNTRGEAWFDDLALYDVSGTQLKPMNTSSGKPMDGLVVMPQQIGVFDPSFPLARACLVRTATDQRVTREKVERRGAFGGWAACAVLGHGELRWDWEQMTFVFSADGGARRIPLLQTYDRYGRLRGAAGALVLHSGGYYAGSTWAVFGVDTQDLFDDPASPAAGVLRDAARFIAMRLSLRGIGTDRRLYRAGETVKAVVLVDNRGKDARDVTIRWSLRPHDAAEDGVTRERTVKVAPNTVERVAAEFSEFSTEHDLYEIRAEMLIDGAPVDTMTTGFVVARPEVLRSGPRLGFKKNYFTLDGRPMFLFGSDTYSYVYKSQHENPLTWAAEHSVSRDFGFNLYECLQYVLPKYSMREADRRDFLAMAQLTQKYGLVFMPGMLVGQNVAIGDKLLSRQDGLCREYARLLRDVPGLLYYLNGDYRMELGKHPEDVRALWNRWLKERYGATERLREVWGEEKVTAELGGLPFPPPNSGRWDDPAAVDRLRFQNWLTRRWNQAHVAAVREIDAEHPITSEYYKFCWGGMDLVQTIDGQDVSNFGFFDKPADDILHLPLKIAFNDLRVRGKGVSLGEYGAKTHPAWTAENGAFGYHIVHTLEQQRQLFMAVAHVGLGMGVSKVQNWCLRDSQEFIFPWGVFHPHEMIPKDCAYVHRNQSVIWRHFSPRYEPSRLTVCLPDNMRLGNIEAAGRTVADSAFETVLSLHRRFNVIDDHHLDALAPECRVMIYPAPFCVEDEAYDRVARWVSDGGMLLVTGDFSYDGDRRRTGLNRLSELAGVERVADLFANIGRPASPSAQCRFQIGIPAMGLSPCMRVRPAGAEVLGTAADGNPVLVRHRVGQGEVWLFTDPTEVCADAHAAKARRRVYAAFLDAADCDAIRVSPAETWLHVMEQPTARGRVYVVSNRRMTDGHAGVELETGAGKVTLQVRNGYPAMAAVMDEGQLVSVSADGRAGVSGATVMNGAGLRAVLSLDGKDLRSSRAILVAPFEAGRLELPGRDAPLTAVVGEFQQGQWTVLERIPIDASSPVLDIDADQATGLILLCEPPAERRWAEHLTRAMLRPQEMAGY
jgi:hypothetical protein